MLCFAVLLHKERSPASSYSSSQRCQVHHEHGAQTTVCLQVHNNTFSSCWVSFVESFMLYLWLCLGWWNMQTQFWIPNLEVRWWIDPVSWQEDTRSGALITRLTRVCVSLSPELVMLGVGYHHAGVDLSDRKLIEKAFTQADLPVLCESLSYLWRNSHAFAWSWCCLCCCSYHQDSGYGSEPTSSSGGDQVHHAVCRRLLWGVQWCWYAADDRPGWTTTSNDRIMKCLLKCLYLS